MIILHYFKRILTEPIGILIYIGLPMVLVILNVVLNVGIMETPDAQVINGYSMIATGIMTIIMVMFQFMGGALIVDYYYRDFKTDQRWRLLASPMPLSRFLFASMLACVTFSILSGGLIIAVSAIFLDAYLHNPFILIAVLVVMALFAQVFGILVSLLGLKKSTAEAITTLFSFAMVIPAGHMFVNFRMGEVGDFIFGRATPYAQAVNAILYSGSTGGDLFGNLGFDKANANMNMALLNVGILLATTIVLGVIAWIVARRRSF